MNARSPAELEAWRSLASGAHGALLAQVESTLASDGHPTPSQLMSWRKIAGADAAGAAVELVRARRASLWKFRDVPGAALRPARELLLDVHGGEQATAWPIGQYKAAKFLRHFGAGLPIADACCGVGADAREFMFAGLDVSGVDIDPLRVWMCAHNSGAEHVADIDAGALDTHGIALHIDPARRAEGRSGERNRLRSLGDLLPPISTVAALAEDSIGACVKLGPGVDPWDLPTLGVPTSLEYISLSGQLSQAAWWSGPLADNRPVLATMLTPGGVAFTIAGDPARDTPAVVEAPLGAHIYTVDPAVERAGLLPTLGALSGLVLVHPALGLLTDDAGARAPVSHPALTPFTVREAMGWRRDRVLAWLRDQGAGIVEVKTRGKACDPDVEQRELRGDGKTPFCVFVLRFGQSVRAIITSRA